MKRFYVISCNDYQEWGYSESNVSRYVDLYKASPDEEWKGLHAIRGDVPTIDDLKTLDGFVISGSPCSVNDNDEWILKLQEFIKATAEFNQDGKKPPKVIGICFGHQLIAKALGGKVGLNPNKDYVLQTEEIKPTNEAEKNESIKGLFDRGSFRIVQSHGECITELPEGAISLGTSASCEYEVVLFKENILGIQSHPNIHTHLAEELLLPKISKSYNWAPEKVKQSSESFKMEVDDKKVNEILVKFLNN